MGKPLSPEERDEARRLAAMRLTPIEVWENLKAQRAQRKIEPPDLTTLRRFLKGKTYSAAGQETRGRKRKFSRRVVLNMDKKRKELLAKADGQYEVQWADVLKKSRAPSADPTTVARSFSREGLDVKWRAPRERPLRGPEHVAERLEACRKWQSLPVDYFTDKVDMITDNTGWDVPATARARKYLNQRKVRGHLRTRSEGLKAECTKPSAKKHHMNTGGKLKLVAGISNCRVVVWHYLDGPWNGEAAAAMYRGTIRKALKRCRGEKCRYVVLEDNDPVGYKSNKAAQAKKDGNIVAMDFPRYSPDLNPLDYFLWQEVESRMEKNKPTRLESVEAFKARLRRTALAIPEAVIRKGVANLRKRVQDCYKNNGKYVSWD